MGDTPNQPRRGAQEARSATIAPALDIPAIRRAAQEGLPMMPGQVLALCERVEALEEAGRGLLDACAVAWTRPGDETMYLSDAELHMGKVLAGRGTALHALACAARAWAGAIERQDVGEIERCEGELIVVITACS
jgi:hypothetical protein